MRVEPSALEGFAKEVWRVADDLGKIRLDEIFSSGSAACGGTDLVKGLATHGGEQSEALRALTERCEDFGQSLKDAAETFTRQDDANERRFANLPNSRLV